MDTFHFTREKKERKKREREGGGEGDMGVFSYHMAIAPFLPCKPDVFLEASVSAVVG